LDDEKELNRLLIPILLNHPLFEIVEIGDASPARVGNDYIQSSELGHGIPYESLQSCLVAYIRSQSSKARRSISCLLLRRRSSWDGVQFFEQTLRAGFVVGVVDHLEQREKEGGC
jgi:hypothetical protein